MSFFNKLFGNSKTNKKLDIDRLLASSNLNNSILELSDYINALCSNGDKIDKLTGPQQNLYFNQCLEAEINNGGFNQYFFNSSGSYANETLHSLKAIGANKTADILLSAINQFPNATVPKNTIERHNILEQIEDDADKVFEELDNLFYAYSEDLNKLNIEYIRANRNFFI